MKETLEDYNYGYSEKDLVVLRMWEDSMNKQIFTNLLIRPIQKLECWIFEDNIVCLGFSGHGEALYKITREPVHSLDFWAVSHLYEILHSGCETYGAEHYIIPSELVTKIHSVLKKQKHKIYENGWKET